ncbi:type I-E CRISPR-associated protein Cse2/CasB [Glycomyces sp. NPDC046736]|uniref:type I-E CRISPR-associated protein Cse2/CasB n=1 Tax=Glycomyces sp. NPDC046736 TaxID=3155615 RepID=UPI0033EB2E0F
MADNPFTDGAHAGRIRRPRNPRRPRPFGAHVAEVVSGLQARYLKQRPDAIATLAQLRHAVNAEPGTTGLEAAWLPDALLELDHRRYDDETHPRATPSERALHTAVTFFALHQQSQRDQRMHTPGTSFANAVQWLATVNADGTVYKRFSSVSSASSYDEITYHARHLVKQLRAAKIGFDYGLFADDLLTFQRQGPLSNGLTGPDHVRSLWGREYWRAALPKAKMPAPPDDSAPDPSTDQE